MFTDFEWCDQAGSIFGLMVCTIGSSNGVETYENGANIEMTTVNVPGSTRWVYLSGKYTEVLTCTFQVCKNPCTTSSDTFTSEELRFFNRWLNRNDGYHKFKLVSKEDPGYAEFYYNAQLNVKKIEFAGSVIGLEITVTCDAPFGYFEPQKIIMNLTDDNLQYVYIDESDEVGSLYPKFEIMCNGTGDFIISNSLSGKQAKISNCKKNELITIDSEHKIIMSSLRNGDIIKDFNFGWLDVVNKFDNRKNVYISNLPCTITMTYSPIAKIGM